MNEQSAIIQKVNQKRAVLERIMSMLGMKKKGSRKVPNCVPKSKK